MSKAVGSSCESLACQQKIISIHFHFANLCIPRHIKANCSIYSPSRSGGCRPYSNRLKSILIEIKHIYNAFIQFCVQHFTCSRVHCGVVTVKKAVSVENKAWATNICRIQNNFLCISSHHVGADCAFPTPSAGTR